MTQSVTQKSLRQHLTPCKKYAKMTTSHLIPFTPASPKGFENLSDAYAVISNGLAVKTSWLAGVNEMAKLSAYNDSIKLIPMIDKMQIARNLAYLDRVRARQIKATRLATIKRLALIALFFTAFGLFALYTGAIY